MKKNNFRKINAKRRITRLLGQIEKEKECLALRPEYVIDTPEMSPYLHKLYEEADYLAGVLGGVDKSGLQRDRKRAIIKSA